jgi:hypothetical protein
VTACSFQTSSEHSTSLGRVRYQHCVCGRFRVLLGSYVLTLGPSEARHANRAESQCRWQRVAGRDGSWFGMW